MKKNGQFLNVWVEYGFRAVWLGMKKMSSEDPKCANDLRCGALLYCQ